MQHVSHGDVDAMGTGTSKGVQPIKKGIVKHRIWGVW